MSKSTRTFEERIQEKDSKIEKLQQELKQQEAQRKQLQKRQKEQERKIRAHRLIEIGAAVESVLGRTVETDEIPKLVAFLNRQETNGKFFSKAMKKSPDTDTVKEEVRESGLP
jgi:septal ring factor EnvC (AmiA/AmiB activator)